MRKASARPILPCHSTHRAPRRANNPPPGRMPRDQRQRFRHQSLARLDAMPDRRARRMRQRYEIALPALHLDTELLPDHLIELVDADELRDGELARRNDEPRLEQLELRVQPRW